MAGLDIYPTGGGTGMVGMWKAFDEIERIGWVKRPNGAHGLGAGGALRADRPRVSAGHGTGAAVGARVDARRRAAGAARHRDFPGSSAPCARAAAPRRVTDQSMVDGMLAIGSTRRQRRARRRRRARRHPAPRRGRLDQAADSVVLFNTGGALKTRCDRQG